MTSAFGKDPTTYTIADLHARKRNSKAAEGEHIRSFQMMARRLNPRPGLEKICAPKRAMRFPASATQFLNNTRIGDSGRRECAAVPEAVKLIKGVTSDRKFGVLITAIGAISFLFVVICPLTPTPAALAGNQGTQICSSGASALQMVAPASHLLVPIGIPSSTRLTASATALQLPHWPHPGHSQLVDLTCARLC
jgi:hypothetical protein